MFCTQQNESKQNIFFTNFQPNLCLKEMFNCCCTVDLVNTKKYCLLKVDKRDIKGRMKS